jgi:hypothetical protein
MNDFFRIYGSLIFQKYVEYCDKFTALDMETQMTPYIKVNFFMRKKKDGKSKNEDVHLLHNEVKVSEVVNYKVKRTSQVTKMNTTAERVVNRKREVTYIPKVITSVETSEIESESSRDRVIESVTTVQGATAVYCNLVFSEKTTEVSTQTEPTRVVNFGISSGMMNIVGESTSSNDGEKKLTACSTSSIHISAADHFVQLDEPRKPMYRHIKSRLGLGKLVEKPESVREMWLAQEIAMLRGQNLINWESKTDQLMGTLFLHEQQPMMQPEVFSDQELANQITALTSDQEVLDMTAGYLNG